MNMWVKITKEVLNAANDNFTITIKKEIKKTQPKYKAQTTELNDVKTQKL